MVNAVTRIKVLVKTYEKAQKLHETIMARRAEEIGDTLVEIEAKYPERLAEMEKLIDEAGVPI